MRRLSLAALFAFLFVQVRLYEDGVSGASVLWYHILLPMVGLLYFRVSVVKVIPRHLVVFMASSVLISVYGYLKYGITIYAFNLPLMLASIVIGFCLPFRTNIADYSRYIALAMGVALFIRFVFHFGDLGVIYSKAYWYEAKDLYIASGGRNLEATAFVFAAILNIRNRNFYWLYFVAFITSMLMQSRVGLIGVSLLSILYVVRSGRVGFRKNLFRLFVVFSSAPLLLILLMWVGFDVLHRFEVSDEYVLYSEGVGRIALWEIALDMFAVNPFGYGVGNGIWYAENYLGYAIRENNFHNIFVSSFVELGLIGGFMYLLLAVRICWYAFRDRYYSEFKVVASCYFIFGIVQFTGYDVFGWLFVGIAEGLIVISRQDYRYNSREIKVLSEIVPS